MLHLGGTTPYIAIAAIAYIAFVFLSESFNPFTVKLDYHRRRWRLARSLALIFFVLSTAALLIEPHQNLTRIQLVIAVAALCFVLGLYPVIKYFKVAEHLKTCSAVKNVRLPTTTTSQSTPSPASKSISQAKNNLVISKRATHTTPPANHVFRTENLSVSEEHKLEVELSQPSLMPEHDHLDQTIAEAEFFKINTTDSETSNLAQPHNTSSSSDLIHNGYDERYSSAQEPFTKHAIETESLSTKTPNAASPDIDAALIQKLAFQNAELEKLAKSNQALIEKRESLSNEVNELKFNLEKSDAMARKGIAQRDQAITIKNRALSLAAMERKKRQITEIKARKALIRMKSSLRELTYESA